MNLLGPDLLGEITIHILPTGGHKIIVSKLEDDPKQELRQRVIQAAIFTAIDLAKERGIAIAWSELEKLYPYKPPQLPPVAPKSG